eukprot:TRINITY_DN2372_c0_g1_i3.p1 TRINITY_DN2372_c0_g1~~TRINITY_DN2372_c0_g1_i3.p1  ORF type:complete len:503 (+),score=110.59 TRINITY_DN2372_c0_g1_i3:195-1703(+)
MAELTASGATDGSNSNSNSSSSDDDGSNITRGAALCSDQQQHYEDNQHGDPALPSLPATPDSDVEQHVAVAAPAKAVPKRGFFARLMARACKPGPALPLTRWERMRFGLMWGFSLAQQDFEKYLVYFLLATATGCDFLDLYYEWVWVSSILAFPINFITGWITDRFSNQQHRVMQCSALLQTTFMLFTIAVTVAERWRWVVLAQACYQCRQAALMQSMTSVWKLLKIRIDVENLRKGETEEMEKDAENIVVSSTGNMGDLCSEVYEATTLMCLSLSNLPLREMSLVMSGCALFSNLAVVVLSFTFRDKDIFLPASRTGNETKTEKTPLVDKPGYGSIKKSDDHTEVALDTLESGGTSQEGSDAAISGGRRRSCGGLLAYAVCGTWHFIKDRALYFWRSAVVKNTSVHALTVLLIYILISYPLTILVAEENANSSEEPTEENYCAGVLTSLLRQGGVLNITFFPCSIWCQRRCRLLCCVHLPPPAAAICCAWSSCSPSTSTRG